MIYYAPGRILRFFGDNAERTADAHAVEFFGRCERVSPTVIRITRPVSLMCTPTLVPRFEFDANDLGRNGRRDAKPSGRTLGFPSR